MAIANDEWPPCHKCMNVYVSGLRSTNHDQMMDRIILLASTCDGFSSTFGQFLDLTLRRPGDRIYDRVEGGMYDQYIGTK